MSKLTKKQLAKQWEEEAEQKAELKELEQEEKRKLKEAQEALAFAEKKHNNAVRTHIRDSFEHYQSTIVNHEAWIISLEGQMRAIVTQSQNILKKFKTEKSRKKIFTLGKEYGVCQQKLVDMRGRIHYWQSVVTTNKPKMLEFQEKLLNLKK